MAKLKSSLEIALEKTKDLEKEVSLSTEQKEKIAEIRRVYEAKIAEKKIILKGKPELAKEIGKLEAERDSKIQIIYQKA